jgi:hypothetical protein
MKICSKCKTEKPLTEFRLVKNRHGNVGPHSYCDDCRKADKRARSGCKPKEEHINLENQTKKCSICKEWKSFSEYDKSTSSAGGVFSQCKCCRIGKSKEHYEANKEVVIQKNRKYYRENKVAVCKKNSDYKKNRCKTDSVYLLKKRCRARIWDALRKKGWTKRRKFAEYLGCTEQEFKDHIESLFTEGMTWEKLHNGEIHIDHHFPLSLAETEEDVYRLCHYKNLKPMWAADNISKSNKLPEN